jgi:PKD repeat protein
VEQIKNINTPAICKIKNVFLLIIVILNFLLILLNSISSLAIADNPLWINVGGPYYNTIGEPTHFYLDIQGGMLPYNTYWTFGDGETSDKRYPTHTYREIGTYAASVTVVDGEGTSITKYTSVIVYQKLSVDTGGPYVGYIGETVNLSVNVTGGIPPYTYSWDLDNDQEFDDANKLNISYIWENIGTYTISIKVNDDIYNTNISITQVNIKIKNTRPNQPLKPNGATDGKINTEYTYTTYTYDPDDDQIWYQWDWGDGEISNWLGPYNSNVTIVVSHSWEEKSSYNIKVKAKDSYEMESPWSDPLPITMPCSYDKPITHIFDWLFQRFPHAFPILRQLLKQ